jgi:hypothetical protein
MRNVRFGSEADIEARPVKSALPPKADMDQQGCDVRFVPKADSCSAAKEDRYSITSSALARFTDNVRASFSRSLTQKARGHPREPLSFA